MRRGFLENPTSCSLAEKRPSSFMAVSGMHTGAKKDVLPNRTVNIGARNWSPIKIVTRETKDS